MGGVGGRGVLEVTGRRWKVTGLMTIIPVGRWGRGGDPTHGKAELENWITDTSDKKWEWRSRGERRPRERETDLMEIERRKKRGYCSPDMYMNQEKKT